MKRNIKKIKTEEITEKNNLSVKTIFNYFGNLQENF